MKSWIYGICVMMAVGAGTVTAEPAKVPVPVWDLAKDAFAATTGRVERVDGRVMMDGESAFAIPNSAITDPSCFTITMEIRFGAIEDGRTLQLLDQRVSDTGFAVDAFKWGVVTTVNGVTYEGNRFSWWSKDGVWKFVFAVRDGVVAEYQNNAAGPQYLLRISPNLAPIWVGRTPGRKGMKALSGYEILSLKVYGPDTKYYLPGESADTLKNGYIGGPGWLIRVPGKIDKPLPRILYYGDSISYGYGEPFSALMKDKAYCYNWCHFVGGVGGFPTAAFEAAAAAAPFDIIIFNNGLHSLSWSPDKVSDAQIEAVLRNMVQAFRKGAPKAKLVWASTTPVTAKGSPVTGLGELNPIVIRINTLAEKVMKEEGVDSVDLYALLKDHLNLACGDTLHWSSEGYQLIAGALQKKCDALLPRPAAKPAVPAVKLLPQPPDVAAEKFGPDGKVDARFAAAHEKFVGIAKEGKAQLVFLGDSITDFWGNHKMIWDKAFSAYQPANFGIAGDRTQHVLWRITNGELDGITPKAVVLLIGINNVGSDPAENIAKGITAIVETIRAKQPQAKILLLAIFPRGDWPTGKLGAPNDKRKQVNAIIAKLDDGKNIFFLDIGDKFLQPDGSLTKEIMPDFLHLSAAAYQIWADAIGPKLAELMK